MNECEWQLGDEVDKLYQYKILGVVKTILAPSPPMLKVTLIKHRKDRYFKLSFIIAKSTR